MLYVLFIGAIVFVFGASIGSFIAASVYRLNKHEGIFGRSYCEWCKKKLGFFELFPIFSFLCLLGRCKNCKKNINIENFLIEIATGVLFTYAFFARWLGTEDSYALSLWLLRDWIFLGGLIFLFVYDFKYKILPDLITLPILFIVFVLNVFLGYGIFYLVLAVVLGGGFFAVQYFVSRGRWVGDGDIRMGALLGAGLGWPGVILAILLAYFIGAISSVPLLIFKKANLKTEIAFGTFLAIGGVIALFFGDYIINWYLNLL